MGRIRVAVNGYGVIGERVADAVRLQDDMVLAGVADIVSDYRLQVATRAGLPVHASTPQAEGPMRAAGIAVPVGRRFRPRADPHPQGADARLDSAPPPGAALCDGRRQAAPPRRHEASHAGSLDDRFPASGPLCAALCCTGRLSGRRPQHRAHLLDADIRSLFAPQEEGRHPR
jgi:hypothetical protein